MYKKQMNEIPANIIGIISGRLDERGLDAVHISYGSMLEGDNDLFAVIARNRKHSGYDCYSVFSFEADPEGDRWKGRLFREANRLSYPDALIEMGGRIKE